MIKLKTRRSQLKETNFKHTFLYFNRGKTSPFYSSARRSICCIRLMIPPVPSQLHWTLYLLWKTWSRFNFSSNWQISNSKSVSTVEPTYYATEKRAAVRRPLLMLMKLWSDLKAQEPMRFSKYLHHYASTKDQTIKIFNAKLPTLINSSAS